MPQNDAIFVLVDQLAIIARAVLAFDGGRRIEVIVAKSALSAEAAVEERARAISVVSMLAIDGPERAVRLASKGARIVICVPGGAERRAELRRLAPGNFILQAATAEQLLDALRAGLGGST